MENKDFEIGLIGGIEKREIVLEDYNSEWPTMFEVQQAIIRNALGNSALNIEHVGSTSVPSLSAKPIIDVIVVVLDSANEATYLPQMLSAGYVLRVREPDWNEHRMFRTISKDVHVHVYSAGCPEIERYLLFRDRLRASTVDRNRYEETKRALASKDWPDMNAYARAKTDVIEDIIAAAKMVGGKRVERLDGDLDYDEFGIG